MIQKSLSYAPGGELLHYGLQRLGGGLRNFSRELGMKVDDWRLMTNQLQAAGMPLKGIRMVEIGTGWFPTTPFCCYLGGAKRIATFDLNPLLKPSLTRKCAEMLSAQLGLIAKASGATEEEVKSRHEGMLARLNRLNIEAATAGVVEYHAPADASQTGLPSGSQDVVISNSVLEHVQPEVIARLFTEAKRILREGGLMYHSVNCGDHYAYVDPSLSQLHYLEYSDPDWQKWNNRFLYQNRLRAHEFVELAERAGFEIALNTAHALEQRLAQLRTVNVHSMFRRFSDEQLCVTTVDIVGRKTQ